MNKKNKPGIFVGEEMEKLTEEIWEVIFRNLENKDNKNNLLTSAAVLLKTSIELYTVALKEDSDIERLITEEAVPSIPKLRDKMKHMTTPTLH